MTAVIVFSIVCVLLFVGKILRVCIPLFQRLYLPSSVVGGLFGLLCFSCFGKYLPPEWYAGLSKMPGFLINIVFAALFLGAAAPKLKEVFSIAFPQLCFGQLFAWGQYVIGLALAGFVLTPLFGLPAAFGNLLEIGFEGGHGTVGGMSQTFADFNWKEGTDLGFTVATAGMIIGIVAGMAMVNWALNKNIISNVRTFRDRDRAERLGIYEDEKTKPSAGKQTVLCDSIDSLAWHIVLIGVSVIIGYGILKGLQYLEILILPDVKTRLFKGFPLFPLCMIGGIIVQLLMQAAKVDKLVDHGQMQRISGAALDFLVVSAVATIKLSVVMKNWLPLLILIVCGTVWGIVLVVFVAPKIFKDSWFERAIADFGQSLGVTATGLMLLRTVDPESKTAAAASFEYKQLFHEPIMGGGLWTALALTLVFTVGWLPVWIISVVFLIFWAVAAFIMARKNRK